jgi:selenophosphate synthase
MSYRIETVRKPRYLHLKVTGENSLQTVREYLAEILDICARNNGTNVLIEECLEGARLNTLDVFNAVKSGASHAGKFPRVIAYVDVHAGSGPGLMHFAESLAQGRGINVRVFDTVPEAEDWLKSVAAADADKNAN